jgi:hypothetical protein
MKIQDIVVLNTVTVLGTDAAVDSNGILNVIGADSIKANRITNMSIQPYVAEVSQVDTLTISAVDNTTYTLAISGVNKQTNAAYFRQYSVTSGTSATATTIGDLFRTEINNDAYVNVTASGTTTLVLTADAGFPAFTTIESDANITIATPTTTAAVIGKGLGSQISADYPSAVYPEIANIVAANEYTTVQIDYEDVGAYGENNTLGNSYKSLLLFVNEGADNFDDLLGTYGTLTGLNAGYRVAISNPATTTAAVTITTGVITLASGSATFVTLDARANDHIVINTGTSFSTFTDVVINSITTATTGVGNIYTAVSAEDFKFASWRPLPL